MIKLLLEKVLQSLLPDENYDKIIYVISPDTDCWECNDRAMNKDGYPVARIKGVLDTLYRHFFRRYNGDIEDGMVVRHTCDNRLCCNPEHLILGTQKQNVDDMLERGRFPIGIKHGRAKLDNDKVAEIRQKFNDAENTITELSIIYSVDRKTIYSILNGTTWRGVGEEQTNG